MTLYENKKSAIENPNGAIQLLKHVCILKKEEPLSEQQTFQRSSCIPGARDHIQETRQIFH